MNRQQWVLLCRFMRVVLLALAPPRSGAAATHDASVLDADLETEIKTAFDYNFTPVLQSEQKTDSET